MPFPGAVLLEQVEVLRNTGFTGEQAKAQITAMQDKEIVMRQKFKKLPRVKIIC